MIIHVGNLKCPTLTMNKGEGYHNNDLFSLSVTKIALSRRPRCFLNSIHFLFLWVDPIPIFSKNRSGNKKSINILYPLDLLILKPHWLRCCGVHVTCRRPQPLKQSNIVSPPIWKFSLHSMLNLNTNMCKYKLEWVKESKQILPLSRESRGI